jgi:crossover junction endodeoxyribonuclease RuvC
MPQMRSCTPRAPSSLFFSREVLQSESMAGTPQGPLRVIGIDPGLNITGYGVMECRNEEIRLLEAGVIRPPRANGNNLPARLESLHKGLREVMTEFRPRTMCLEEVYTHASYPRTSILMGHARGVICLAARQTGVAVVNLSAKRIKQSVTGNGNASKAQVQRAVQQAFSLGRVPHPPDVADALAAGLCYAYSLKAASSRFCSQKILKRRANMRRTRLVARM